MHSVRRAAFRAASSSLAAASLRQQAGSAFALQFTKAAARPAMSIPVRLFSQTARVAQEQDQNEQAIVDEAIKSTEDKSTLESTPAATRSGAQEEGAPIFISNMTFDATDMHLREAFGKYGEVTEVKIARDARGLSRGFAFVTFTDKSAADRAVAECNSSFWHGRRINVEHRKPRENNSERTERTERRPASTEPSTSIYIGNIPYETSDADLNRLFRELENVTDVRVAIDRNTGWPRGFAHADFADIESAIKAHDKITSTTMGGRTLKCDYSQKDNGSGGRDRSGGDRSGGDRSGGGRFGGRSGGDRSGGGRFGGDRSGGDRSGGRFGGDRSGGDRSGGDRSYGRQEPSNESY